MQIFCNNHILVRYSHMAKTKVLTNVRAAQTAGIAQVVFSFLDYVENNKKNVEIIAVNVKDKDKKSYRKLSGKNTGMISVGVKFPNIGDVTRMARGIEDVKREFEDIIGAYQKAIRKEKPDMVLINGTYFLPWCLLLAAERENIPSILHYHGVLTKEVSAWEKHQRKIFLEMEKCFDRKDLFYIFPSKITKKAVEEDVFGHKINKFSILQNPVPEYFFTRKNKIKNKNIGIVSRWTKIKNTDFYKDFAKYNHENGSKFSINIVTDLNENHKDYKKLSKIVKFCKPKSNKKLASFYRNMGVVISPSYFETYGNVAKEAIACGTPAVVSKNMGVSETFNFLGLDDWVINFNSVKSVYKEIEKVIGSKVQEEVRDSMEYLYSPQKIFDKIIRVIKERHTEALA